MNTQKLNTKEAILERAKNIPPMNEKEAKEVIAAATEDWFLTRLIQHNEMQLSNLRVSIKNLMKEKQLLINIKKKWNS